MMPDEDHRTHIAHADPDMSPSPQTDDRDRDKTTSLEMYRHYIRTLRPRSYVLQYQRIAIAPDFANGGPGADDFAFARYGCFLHDALGGYRGAQMSVIYPDGCILKLCRGTILCVLYSRWGSRRLPRSTTMPRGVMNKTYHLSS